MRCWKHWWWNQCVMIHISIALINTVAHEGSDVCIRISPVKTNLSAGGNVSPSTATSVRHSSPSVQTVTTVWYSAQRFSSLLITLVFTLPATWVGPMALTRLSTLAMEPSASIRSLHTRSCNIPSTICALNCPWPSLISGSRLLV